MHHLGVPFQLQLCCITGVTSCWRRLKDSYPACPHPQLQASRGVCTNTNARTCAQTSRPAGKEQFSLHQKLNATAPHENDSDGGYGFFHCLKGQSIKGGG